MKRVINERVVPEAMTARDLSWRELALLVEMPQSTVRLVAEGRSAVGPAKARLFAERLRVSVSDLFVEVSAVAQREVAA